MHVHGPREVELRLQRVENGGRLERWRSRLAGQLFNTRCHRNTGKDRVWALHIYFLPISWFILWKRWRCSLWDLKPGYSYSGGFELKFRPKIGYSELFVFSPVPLSIGGRYEATISSFQARTQNFSLGGEGVVGGWPYNLCFILKLML